MHVFFISFVVGIYAPMNPPEKKLSLKDKLFLDFVTNLSTNWDLYQLLNSAKWNSDSMINTIIATEARQFNYRLPPTSDTPLSFIKSRLGDYSKSDFPLSIIEFQNILQAHSDTRKSEQRRRHHKARRIGISKISLSDFPDIPIVRLSRRSIEYPPRNHYILENHGVNEKFPETLKVRDSTCTYKDTFHRLDRTQLSHTLSQDQSCIYIDNKTGGIIAIVIRHLAKQYFPSIQRWATKLIKESLRRRSKSQRNNPGALARVGVSEGARNARLFGWVRNLTKKNPADRLQHEQEISSLFGVKYALLRGQIPWVTNKFESIMSASNLPRLDQNRNSEFTIPLDGDSVSFQGYPLAPPEGYIAVDYAKYIHKDTHWIGCPWAAYWNISRIQTTGLVGPESGASFFISDYGIRILNDSNTCVVWNVSHWHGTGWYDNKVSHVGIAMLLSRTTERVWNEYKRKILSGELSDGDLLWTPDEEDLER